MPFLNFGLDPRLYVSFDLLPVTRIDGKAFNLLAVVLAVVEKILDHLRTCLCRGEGLDERLFDGEEKKLEADELNHDETTDDKIHLFRCEDKRQSGFPFVCL